MKVKDLRIMLSMMDGDATVYVGCQGYTNRDDPKDEYSIEVEEKGEYENKYIIISDGIQIE